MARRRILLALVPPLDVLDACRSMRRALGDLRPERIVPHVTVVAPVNLRDEELSAYRRHVRNVVARTDPFTVIGSRFATFLPNAPTVHLEIEDENTGELHQLRSELCLEGVIPAEVRPYRPHLTIRSRSSEEQIRSLLAATSERFVVPRPQAGVPTGGSEGAGYQSTAGGDRSTAGGSVHHESGPLLSWTVASIHLMEQHHESGEGTRWRSVAEEPFGPEAVVGRGGVELVMRTASVLDAAIADHGMLKGAFSSHESTGDVSAAQERPGGELLCVTVEHADSVGHPVGVAIGRIRGNAVELLAIEVHPDHRGIGIGAQLLAHWTHRANEAGASIIWSDTQRCSVGPVHAQGGGVEAGGAEAGDVDYRDLTRFLCGAGFVPVGRHLVRDPG